MPVATVGREPVVVVGIVGGGTFGGIAESASNFALFADASAPCRSSLLFAVAAR